MSSFHPKIRHSKKPPLYPQSKLKECRYIPFENTVADAQLRMKGVKALYHMNKTHCAGGCGGFQSQYSQMSRKKVYFPVTAPLMQKEYPPMRSTVHVKTCSNDLSTWQVLQPVTQTGQNGEISVVLDFSGRRKTEDTGRLFYRDSWVFEGKRAITHNIEISKSFSPIRTSEYTGWFCKKCPEGVPKMAEKAEKRLKSIKIGLFMPKMT